MSAKTVAKSQFNAYPKSIQDTLIAQGFTVVEDAAPEGSFPNSIKDAAAAAAQTDLLADDEPVEDEKCGIWMNLDAEIKGKDKRVTGVSLDFALFRNKDDREEGKEDPMIRSLINTIEKHGLVKVNEEMTFKVTFTKQGESSISPDTDLLA